MSLKTEVHSKFHEYIDKAKKYYVTQIKNFDPEKMVLCTIVFEGTPEEVAYQYKTIKAIALKHNGFMAGN